jgi:PAS domain S-box-containing protein
MSAAAGLPLTGRERTFPESEIIVSKTDARGHLTYVNDVFLQISGYREGELLAKPHNIVRHPEMPRCLFRLMWESLRQDREIFVYINNRAKNGDHYWVFAHVTPNYDAAGDKIGYHSNRRAPRREAVRQLIPLYQHLAQEERRPADTKAGLDASTRLLSETLARKGLCYDEFILDL